jgi:hypothetical protein
MTLIRKRGRGEYRDFRHVWSCLCIECMSYAGPYHHFLVTAPFPLLRIGDGPGHQSDTMIEMRLPEVLVLRYLKNLYLFQALTFPE